MTTTSRRVLSRPGRGPARARALRPPMLTSALLLACATPGHAAAPGSVDLAMNGGAPVAAGYPGLEILGAEITSAALDAQQRPYFGAALAGFVSYVVRLTPEGALDPTYEPAGGSAFLLPNRAAQRLFAGPRGAVLETMRGYGQVGAVAVGPQTPDQLVGATNVTDQTDTSVVAGATDEVGAAFLASAWQGVLTVLKLSPAGPPDPGFGDGTGVARRTVGASAQGAAVITLPGGRVVAATAAGEHVAFAALAGDSGAPDGAFGPAGMAAVPLPSPGEPMIAAAHDGAIIVAAPQQDLPTGAQVAVARLTPDGQLDGSFGAQGIARVQPRSEPLDGVRVSALIVQPDGRIIVGGTATRTSGEGSWTEGFVSRMMPTGEPDGSFGEAGFVRFGPQTILGAAVRSGDRLWVASGSPGYPIIWRLELGDVASMVSPAPAAPAPRSPTPRPLAARAGQLIVERSTVRVTGRTTATVRVRCDGALPCSGKLSLIARDGSLPTRPRRLQQAKIHGTTAYRLLAGSRGSLRIGLPARLFRQHRTVKLRAWVRPDAGAATTTKVDVRR